MSMCVWPFSSMMVLKVFTWETFREPRVFNKVVLKTWETGQGEIDSTSGWLFYVCIYVINKYIYIYYI